MIIKQNEFSPNGSLEITLTQDEVRVLFNFVKVDELPKDTTITITEQGKEIALISL